MASFPVAMNRLFTNMWICMSCTGKQRSSEGKQPHKCRKCGSKRFRQKNKAKKAAA